MNRKGIILAGGSGTRLHPLTRAVSKQLMPVYDKPMIYYPLCTLLQAGMREILVITTPHERELFERLLLDGSQWGIEIEYAVQPSPDGLAQALIIGESFLDGAPSALVLGDNIFYGEHLPELFESVAAREHGATIFGYWVKHPEAYGVAELDERGAVVGLEEKPREPKSHYAVAGLYFYDGRAPTLARTLLPSARGELEITDLNRLYLRMEELRLERFGRGVAWLDTGRPDHLLQAASFIQTIQERQGLRVACPEEVAFRNGWIDDTQLRELAAALQKTSYGEYLRDIAEGAR
jgi:glucose-1-phosphate thymidylyltransferase